MADVSLHHLSKCYPNGVWALRDLNLNLASGEFVVVVGPSGSGKTTTLRLIAGLEEPSDGTVRIGGRLVNALPPHQRQVALVFQRPALYPHLTVRDNLGFSLKLATRHSRLTRLAWRLFRPGRHAKVREQDQRAADRITEIARLLRLENLLERRADQLSGGQQQRVALGRALVREPKVFLLDEPLSNLEVRLRLEMRRELHLLQRQLRATMIYVTHDPGEALALGDRILVLDQGQAQQVGPPLELLDRPANRFVAGFLNWPPMNFVDGHIHAEDSELWFKTLVGRWPLPPPPEIWASRLGKALTLGIGPENVQIEVSGQTAGSRRSWLVVGEEVGFFSPPPAARLVAVRHGDSKMTALVPRGPEPRLGQMVMVTLNLEKGHWFDPWTGIALAVRVGTG
jgi:multiple sugar transport system ATP-binding protein